MTPDPVSSAMEAAAGHLKRGDVLAAQQAFYRARDASRKSPTVMRAIADAWKAAGWNATMALDDPESGWAMFHNARAVYASLGAPAVWEVVRGMAIAAGKMGEHEEALRLCDDAERLAPDAVARAKVWNTRAVACSYLGRFEEAQEWAAKAYEATTDPAVRKTARQSLGVARLRQGEPDAAIALLENEVLRAWAHLEAGRPEEALKVQPGVRPRAFAIRARAWMKLGRPAKALAEARRGARVLEDGRAALDTDDARAAFAGARQELPSLLIRLCADRKRWTEAFHQAEAARARAFLDFLARPQRRSLSHLRPSERGRFEKVRARIEELQRSRSDGAELRRLEDEERMSLRRYEKERLARARVQPREPLTSAAVRRALRPGEALVQFQLADDALLAFVLTRAKFTPVRLPAADILDSARDLPRALALARRDERGGARAFADWHFGLLGDALLAPLPLKGVNRLIVVPHGPLHLVPFPALRLHGSPAIDHFDITLAPSASVWATLRAREHASPTRPTCLFIKDPTGTLPAADAEELALHATFGPRLTTLAGPAATRAAVAAAAPRHDLLHFATHAVYRPDRSGLSFLELADARLSASDLLSLDLSRTRHVTLSACDSARGDWSRAEEMVGLPRAFLRAGAASVLATLWPLEDHAAIGGFMQAFYGSGCSAAEAQREASREGSPETVWGAWARIGS